MLLRNLLTKLRTRRKTMARVKESYEEEYERFYGEVIAPQQDMVDIPSSEDVFGKYYGDNEPAF